MHFIKHNLILFFLIGSSIAMGVLAFSTALKLREFRQISPQQTTASTLTTTCKLTFTIKNSLPRNENPPPTDTVLIKSTPTNIPVITSQPTMSKITPTVKISPTRLPSAPASTTTLKPTVTQPKTAGGINPSPTTFVEPDVPVSGINWPTVGAILMGIVLLGLGIFFKKSPVISK